MMHYYDIHGIVKVVSDYECNIPTNFKVKSLNDWEILIRRDKFKIEKNLKKLGLKFFGDKGKLYLTFSTFKLPGRLLIKDLENKTTILFSRSMRFFAINSLLTLILQYKLLQKGCTFLHAGGFCKNGKATIVCGWSEMGKSSTILKLSEKYEILGDDVIIISKDGYVYPYPLKIGVFSHTKLPKNFKLNVFHSIRFKLKKIVASIPPFFLYIDPNIRIDLSNFARIGKKCKIDRIVLLEHGNKEMKKLDKEKSINKIVSLTYHSLFSHYFARDIFNAYCYFNSLDPFILEKGMASVLKSINKEFFVIRSKEKDFWKFLC